MGRREFMKGDDFNGTPEMLGSLAEEVGSHVANKLAQQAIDEAAYETQKAMIREKMKELIGDKEIKKPLFYESMTQATGGAGRIRVWRHYDTLPDEVDMEILLLISKIPVGASMKDVVDLISTIKRVTAIELVDPRGNGAVVYLEW